MLFGEDGTNSEFVSKRYYELGNQFGKVPIQKPIRNDTNLFEVDSELVPYFTKPTT